MLSTIIWYFLFITLPLASGLASKSRNWPRSRPWPQSSGLGLGHEILASFNITANNVSIQTTVLPWISTHRVRCSTSSVQYQTEHSQFRTLWYWTSALQRFYPYTARRYSVIGCWIKCQWNICFIYLNTFCLKICQTHSSSSQPQTNRTFTEVIGLTQLPMGAKNTSAGH